jgi:hypothetical protein
MTRRLQLLKRARDHSACVRRLGLGLETLLIGWAVFLAACPLGSGVALAFCPEPNPPRVCTEFFHVSAVFVGTVISVTKKKGTDDFIDGWSYLLNVDKNYRGAERSPIYVFTSNDSGRFPMKIGHTYLLFPSWSNRRLNIYGCGNSTELSKANDLVQQLDEIEKNMEKDSGGDIGGQVHLTSGVERGLGGITILAKGNRETYSGVTDQKGAFHIQVPAGRYTVQAESSKWIIRAEDVSYELPDHVQIRNGGCADLSLRALPSQAN